MKVYRWLVSIVLVVLLGFSLIPQGIVYAGQSPSPNYFEWVERRTDSFAIIYPNDYETFAQTLFLLYEEALEQEYNRLASLFSLALDLPITIRIYPQIVDFHRLNATTLEIPEDSLHTHIGSQEIALIGENIAANMNAWLEEGVNAFRNELAALFVEKIASGKAPPGLLAGMAVYAEDPQLLLQNNPLSPHDREKPPLSWRELWEDPLTWQDRHASIQAMTIVATLVDAYGWPKFLEFMNRLPTSEGYRQALTEVYGKDFGALQAEWLNYYPQYFSERWQFHPFYNFDLTRYEQLIQAGAYTQAVDGLKQAAEYLQSVDEQQKLGLVQELLTQAESGKQAFALAARARRAILTGEYNQAIELSDQADQLFEQLGNPNRQEELAAYRNLAEEILDLRQEAEMLVGTLQQPNNEQAAIQRLETVGRRLAELGDRDGQELAFSGLERINQNQQKQVERTGLVGGAILLSLLLIRIILGFIRPVKEARLW